MNEEIALELRLLRRRIAEIKDLMVELEAFAKESSAFEPLSFARVVGKAEAAAYIVLTKIPQIEDYMARIERLAATQDDVAVLEGER